MISRNLSSNTYEQSKENFKKSAILFDSFLRDPQVKYFLWHTPTPLNQKKIKGPLQMSAWGTKEHKPNGWSCTLDDLTCNMIDEVALI